MANSSGGAVNKIPWLHHTSHQAGSTDPINIAGLAGIPTELTTHAGVTTGVHGLIAPINFYVYNWEDVILPGAPRQIVPTATLWDTGPYWDFVNSYYNPKVAGTYMITFGCGLWALGIGKWWAGYIYKNGILYAKLWKCDNAGLTDVNGVGTVPVQMNGTTDQISCWVGHNDVGALNLQTGPEDNFISGCLIK